MRKKDYDLIAGVFRVWGKTIGADDQTIKWLAESLATEFANQGYKFDRQKFLTACGIETATLDEQETLENTHALMGEIMNLARRDNKL